VYNMPMLASVARKGTGERPVEPSTAPSDARALSAIKRTRNIEARKECGG